MSESPHLAWEVPPILRDPLMEVTRKERRSLLAASLAGIAITKLGIVPEKIAALGIEFSPTDKSRLAHTIAFVITYFLAAFFLYGTTDFLAWRIAVVKTSQANSEKFMQQMSEKRDRYTAPQRHSRIVIHSVLPASIARGLFEFALPIVIAAYVIVSLLRAKL